MLEKIAMAAMLPGLAAGLTSDLAAQLDENHYLLPARCRLPTNIVPYLRPDSDPLLIGTVAVLTIETQSGLPTALQASPAGAPVLGGRTPAPFDMGIWLGYPAWGLGCWLWSDQSHIALGVADPGGRWRIGVRVPDDQSLVGMPLWLQAFSACPTCPLGLAPTNGLDTRIRD